MSFHFRLMFFLFSLQFSFQSSSEMANIEVLNGFFKLFQIFGLQYFSFKDLGGKLMRKRPDKFYKLYFGFVLILLCSAMSYYVSMVLKIDEKKFIAKNALNILIRLFMNFGLIAVIFIGIVESFVKTNQLKKVYMNIMEVSALCLVHFDYEINYTSFKKSWRKKFYSALGIFTFSYGLTILTFVYNGHKVLSYLIGFFPIVFFGVIILKFTLHVDLVNLQLENMQNLMTSEVFMKVNSTNPVNIRHVLQNRALALRKIYNIVYDTAEIVSNILAISALLILILLTVIIVNSAFRCVVAVISGLGFEEATSE